MGEGKEKGEKGGRMSLGQVKEGDEKEEWGKEGVGGRGCKMVEMILDRGEERRGMDR